MSPSKSSLFFYITHLLLLIYHSSVYLFLLKSIPFCSLSISAHRILQSIFVVLKNDSCVVIQILDSLECGQWKCVTRWHCDEKLIPTVWFLQHAQQIRVPCAFCQAEFSTRNSLRQSPGRRVSAFWLRSISNRNPD